MNYQPWVGLPNILLGEFVVPEFLQGDATAAKLSRAGLEWLDNPARVAALRLRFEQLHRELRCNTALAATNAIETILAN
jgi:lipid-A-disaccharide synthase